MEIHGVGVGVELDPILFLVPHYFFGSLVGTNYWREKSFPSSQSQLRRANGEVEMKETNELRDGPSYLIKHV